MDNPIARDRELLVTSRQRGRLPLFGAFLKLSGPGWLQGAITLGGGSLAGSLYLGVLAGYSMIWLQIVAIGFGVVMLSAIGYVTLATGRRPFKAINEHVNPVLGWGWAIATMIANLVWLMPQFSLGTAAIQQNLLPRVAASFGEPEMMASTPLKLAITLALFVVAMAIVWSYHQGGRGIKLFESLLKIMVAIIILSFVGVVATLAGQLPWDQIGWGLIPDLSLLSKPAATWTPLLDNVDAAWRGFWENRIVSEQRDVMITAAATAVGINMTFFLPYSMLARGWDREFRGLAIFDLSTGLLIPFVLATGCVVIASASQFHAQPAPGLLATVETQAAGADAPVAGERIQKNYMAIIDTRLAAEIQKRWPNVSAGERMAIADYVLKQKLGENAYRALSGPDRHNRALELSSDELGPHAGTALVGLMTAEQKLQILPASERTMAATLVTRDSNDLANTLTPLTGPTVAHLVFGVGVVSMALSSIIMLMLINGFVLCEMCDKPGNVALHRIGALIAACSGMLGPFFWGGKAAFWVAVPTSVFNFSLLPVAYITFAILMNQRSLLGRDMPRGGKRLLWNVLMTCAASAALLASVWSIWSKAGYWGLGAMGAFVLLAGIFHVFVPRKPLELAVAQEAGAKVQA